MPDPSSPLTLALLGTGRMGLAVASAAESAGHTVGPRLGRAALAAGPDDVAEALQGSDVAIDFTHADQVPASVEAAAKAGVALVVGTTGWSADAAGLERVSDAGRGVVHGPNFSLGVHLFVQLAREAARLADAVGGYDVHLDEAHHRFKKDHPSGTAIRVAETLLEELSDKDRWELGPFEGAARDDTLYVTSARAGHIPGTHAVGLEGLHDRLELRHEARGREGFAQGAVRAAEWVARRTGIFTFEEVVDDLLATDESSRERSAG
jgi:4-hydroxy-tetrahydrodipicolinate reductase